MCLLWSTNWGFISQKTAFFIVTAVKTCSIQSSSFSSVFQALVAIALSVGSAARTKRQRHTPSDDKQVIVNIHDEEKTQYLEQNFNSSKILTDKLNKLNSCFEKIWFQCSDELRMYVGTLPLSLTLRTAESGPCCNKLSCRCWCNQETFHKVANFRVIRPRQLSMKWRGTEVYYSKVNIENVMSCSEWQVLDVSIDRLLKLIRSSYVSTARLLKRIRPMFLSTDRLLDTIRPRYLSIYSAPKLIRKGYLSIDRVQTD
jgi:hypothetical protein